MFFQFKELLKEHAARGWRLNKEEEQFFLSKFDERFNDDEFRFYLLDNKQELQIVKAEKIRNYKKIVSVDPAHPYSKKAHELCQAFSEKHCVAHS